MRCKLNKGKDLILVESDYWYFSVPVEKVLNENGMSGDVTELSEDDDHVVLRIDDERFAYISKDKLWELRQ